jgi:hypothetical protein
VKADHKFVRALFASNGEQFGTGILDSAPSRITTCLRGPVLISAFLDAFLCAPNALEVIRMTETAYEKEIDFAPMGVGIPGWEEPMKGGCGGSADRGVSDGDPGVPIQVTHGAGLY